MINEVQNRYVCMGMSMFVCCILCICVVCTYVDVYVCLLLECMGICNVCMSGCVCFSVFEFGYISVSVYLWVQ